MRPRRCASAEIAVSDLGLRRPTLDDVFLQLTGAPPSEDGGGPEVRDRGPPDRRRERPCDRGRPRRPRGDRRGGGAPRRGRCARTSPTRAVVTGRNLRHFVRQPELLVFSTIQPIMFVLLFTYVFGGAIEWLAARRRELHRLPVARASSSSR